MEAARPATPADVPRLVELCRMARAELGARERGGDMFVTREARPEPVEESLAAAVDDPALLVLAGTYDGVIVGYATGRVEALRDGRCLGLIDELFVEELARAVGVGEAMMDQLLAWFRGRGCTGVDSTALPGARETKNFFEESGFTARLLVMHHRLEP
ncbi:MAG: GNAT family N-acetyltransferase [Actinomycetota bacterium]